ncbi:hypothetical protein [Roseibium sp.]|uniref:hypothetical protein n=1 Tax=Roseibium sp. TaxID=1936156 RepID=UPI003BA915CE
MSAAKSFVFAMVNLLFVLMVGPAFLIVTGFLVIQLSLRNGGATDGNGFRVGKPLSISILASLMIGYSSVVIFSENETTDILLSLTSLQMLGSNVFRNFIENSISEIPDKSVIICGIAYYSSILITTVLLFYHLIYFERIRVLIVEMQKKYGKNSNYTNIMGLIFICAFILFLNSFFYTDFVMFHEKISYRGILVFSSLSQMILAVSFPLWLLVGRLTS